MIRRFLEKSSGDQGKGSKTYEEGEGDVGSMWVHIVSRSGQ